MGYFGRAIASPLSWNMLCTNPDQVGQGTWGRMAYADSAFGAIFYNVSNTEGDRFSVKVRVPKGTYRLNVSGIRDFSTAIVSFKIDGVEWKQEDLFSAVNDGFWTTEIADVPLNGEHTIEFEVVGKNASATGYYFACNEMSLTRTGA